jgi:hypothetical protein
MGKYSIVVEIATNHFGFGWVIVRLFRVTSTWKLFSSLLPGWEEGLLHFSLGQRAILRIPSELGYGNHDISGVIPANSDLDFDIELLNIYRPVKPIALEDHVHTTNCKH